MVADVPKRDVGQCVWDDLLEGEYKILLHEVENFLHSFIATHILKVYKILWKESSSNSFSVKSYCSHLIAGGSSRPYLDPQWTTKTPKEWFSLHDVGCEEQYQQQK